jgi:xylan 1,4-beta-xylosidase
MAAYGVSDNPNLNFRNTEYYPSYVVANFKKLADIEDDYGREIDALTWAFTFHGERCFEGTRSFTTNDVQKPLLNLFKMYSMLGDVRVQLTSSGVKNPMLYRDCCDVEEKTDIDGIAAISGNKSIVFLLYCHNDDWDAEGEYKIYVEVTNLPFKGSDGRLEHYRIDKDHSNAYAEWVRQGRPDYPTPSQNAVIKSSENLELLEPETYVTLTDGKFKKIISIPVNGISLLRLSSE